MASPSSQQADRILALLYVLLQGEHTREEIYQKVPAYELAPSLDAKQRVFERDINHLKGSLFVIEVSHQRTKRYRASFPQ